MTTTRRRRPQPQTEIGFVVTPEEIANRIAALDRGVQALQANFVACTHPAVNTPYRVEWEAYRRRWAVERDSYASWSARLFATRVIPRIEAYETTYAWWAKDFQKRTGTAPGVPQMVEQTDLSASLIPTQVWWILAGAAALIVVTKL